MTDRQFPGFPALAKSTVIPNGYFLSVLAEVESANELLAFLWVSQLVQEKTGEARFTSEAEIWGLDPARRSFERLADGSEGLRRGLRAAVQRGVLISVPLREPGGDEELILVNNPSSRRVAARARAGEIQLKPSAVVVEPERPTRSHIFTLYEQHVGTITPFVGEQLLAAAERYSQASIEAAFREAAELNVRNWRYVERMLERWDREGRSDDAATRGNTLEERKRRFLGPEPGGQSPRSRAGRT